MRPSTKRVGFCQASGGLIGAEFGDATLDRRLYGRTGDLPPHGEGSARHHTLIENADWPAVEGMLRLKNITRETVSAEEFEAKRQYLAGNGIGGYPFVGTPDKVAAELANLSRAGVRGIAVSFVNYRAEFPFFRDEVLPRLVDLGVRARM